MIKAYSVTTPADRPKVQNRLSLSFLKLSATGDYTTNRTAFPSPTTLQSQGLESPLLKLRHLLAFAEGRKIYFGSDGRTFVIRTFLLP